MLTLGSRGLCVSLFPEEIEAKYTHVGIEYIDPPPAQRLVLHCHCCKQEHHLYL